VQTSSDLDGVLVKLCCERFSLSPAPGGFLPFVVELVPDRPSSSGWSKIESCSSVRAVRGPREIALPTASIVGTGTEIPESPGLRCASAGGLEHDAVRNRCHDR